MKKWSVYKCSTTYALPWAVKSAIKTRYGYYNHWSIRCFATWREAFDYAREQATDYYLDHVFTDPWRN